MGRIILTHVGTSTLRSGALQRRPPADYDLRLEQLKDNQRLDPQTKAAWQQHLLKQVRPFWQHAGAGQRNQLDQSPAEIASLSLLPSTDADRIILLHTDTADGELCAELLRNLLIDPELASRPGFPHGAVEIMRIPELRIADGTYTVSHADEFIRKGITSYVDLIWKIFTQRQPAQPLIFNITGGYKGMVPIARDLSGLLSAYARMIGQPLKAELCYLYEDSAALIRYEALPILLDWGAIPDTLLERAVKPHGIDIGTLSEVHQPLFEPISKLSPRWCRSALGEVVWALCQPGRIDYRKISAPERDRLEQHYVVQQQAYAALQEEWQIIEKEIAMALDPSDRLRLGRRSKSMFAAMTAMEPELRRVERLLGLE